jgi:methylmalonyl-CoA/ethylmalonyl-CoA epimerase
MRLHQVAQHAEDLERATAFYSRLLDAEPVASFDPPGLVFFDLDGVRLLLDRAAPSALVYLAVEDVRAATAHLRVDGVEVLTQPHVIFRDDEGTFGAAEHDEWMAFIKDSEGNTIGLASRHPSA